MKRLSKPHKSQLNFSWNGESGADRPSTRSRNSPLICPEPSLALDAKMRMIRLPIDPDRSDEDQVLFVAEDLWVPVSVVNGNVHILPVS